MLQMKMVARAVIATATLCGLLVGVAGARSATTTTPSAPARVGVLDRHRLISESVLGKEASARLRKLRDRQGDEIEKLAGEMREIERKMNARNRAALEKSYAQKATAYKRLQEDARRELEAAEKRELSELERRISPLIAQFGKAKGYKLILDKSILVDADDAVDVTDDVLRIINKSAAAAAAQTHGPALGVSAGEAVAPPKAAIVGQNQPVENIEKSGTPGTLAPRQASSPEEVAVAPTAALVVDNQPAEDSEDSEPAGATSWADSPFMNAVDQATQQGQQLNRDLAEKNRREKERAREYLARANDIARQQRVVETRARIAAQTAQADAQARVEAQARADSQARAEAQARADEQAKVRAQARSNAQRTGQQEVVSRTPVSPKDTSGVSLATSSLGAPVNTGISCEPCNPTGGCPTRWDQAVRYSVRNPYDYAVRVHVSVSVQTGSSSMSTVNPIIDVGPGQTASDTQSFYTACDFYAPNPNTRYQVRVTGIDAE